MNVWPLPLITFHELSTIQESRLTALITSPAAWANVRGLLELPIAIQAEPTRIDRDFLESLGTEIPSSIGVIYALGSDLTINAAKAIAFKCGKPLMIIPTAFSSDAPFSPTAEVSDKTGLIDLPTGSAQEVIIDWHLITDSPPNVRGSGIVDVIAMTTALLDWRYAAQKNKITPETRVVPWAVSVAAAIAMQAVKVAPAVGQGTPEALRSLLDLMCLMVQLDNQLGHRRASHGTEHLFADVVKADPSVSHIEKVAAGILYAAALHGQDPAPLRSAIESAGVRLNGLDQADIRAAAKRLSDYAQAHDAPFTLGSDQTDQTAINAALSKSTLLDDPAKPATPASDAPTA